MPTVDSGINHVSDTALLVAGCRAVESARPDAFFYDPYAARLAGERGMGMIRELPHPEIMEFGIAIRTKFIDDLLLDTISAARLTTAVSVGSGLDTRPWRLKLPADLRIEKTCGFHFGVCSVCSTPIPHRRRPLGHLPCWFWACGLTIRESKLPAPLSTWAPDDDHLLRRASLASAAITRQN